MQMVVSRRHFIARLAGAGAAFGLAALLVDGGAPSAARAAPLVPAASLGEPPIRMRLAALVQEGDEFRRGLAEGVYPPGQGGAWALTADRTGGRFTSAPLQLEFPCSHVGLHWQTDGGAAHPLRVELRSSRDGGRWSPWRHVRVEAHGRDATTGETFGALVGGRSAARLQYRLTFGEGWPVGDGIRRVTLTYLDAGQTPPGRIGAAPTAPGLGPSGVGSPDVESPGVGPRDVAHSGGAWSGYGQLRAAAGPLGFLQRVIPREVWGADEALRFVDGKDQWPRAFVTPKLLVVHHTATENSYPDAAAEVRAIYAYHTVTQGFGDIGYNLLIDNSGQAYEGRRGRDVDPDAPASRELMSPEVVAGHVLGYNYGSVGIALLGTFADAEPSPSALQTLEEALAFEATRHQLDPLTRVDFLRALSRTGEHELWRDNLEAVAGHSDCVPAECPGDRLYARLPALRQQAAQRVGAPGPRAQVTRAPDNRNVWPTDLVFAWEGAEGAAEFSARLEGWRLSDEPDRIVPLGGYEPDERPAWGPWSRERSTSFPLPPGAQGHYTLHVRARTLAGQPGAYSTRWPLFVDRHVVADNADSRRAARQGPWQDSTRVLGFNAAGYEVAEPATATSPASFTWTLDVPEDGVYRVLACWTAGYDRATNARFTIESGGQQLASAEVNQRERGDVWVELARVPLQAGTPCRVELTNDADGVVIADAVRLVLDVGGGG